MDYSALIHQLRIEEFNYGFVQWRDLLFSFKWWVLIILVAASYFVWWKLTDKSRLIDLLLFGSFVAVMRIIFDDIVVGMGLYAYPVRLLLALGYMLVYQFAPSWRSFFFMECSLVGSMDFCF